MKTEATHPAEVAAGATASRSTPETEGERAGPTFPEVLGQRGAAASDTATATATVTVTGPEGESPGGFVALVSGLAAQVVVASQAFSMRRGGLDPSGPPRGRREDPLDPATRQAAQLAPPMPVGHGESAAPRADGAVEARAHASLEEVLPAIVRRIAWSGDGKKGSLRLEFGAGALAGGTLVVHADEGRVRVSLSAPEGADARAWKERIAARLEEKRICVDELVVD
jgi:hypothetical protein